MNIYLGVVIMLKRRKRVEVNFDGDGGEMATDGIRKKPKESMDVWSNPVCCTRGTNNYILPSIFSCDSANIDTNIIII